MKGPTTGGGLTMTADDYFEIQNLIHRYAWHLDHGDFIAMGNLFAHADVYAQGYLLASSDAAAVTREYDRYTRKFENGTPRTRHMVTNLIIEPHGVDQARASSYVMVFQQTDRLPLQPVIGGDYLDTFAKVNGSWRFTERRIGTEVFGDLSQHLLIPMQVPQGYARPQDWPRP